MSEGSQLFSLFGNIEPGPLHPNNPNDPSVAFYDEKTKALRYTFDTSQPDGWWAIDVKTGKKAFHISNENEVRLPSGQKLRAPGVARAVGKPAAAALYGRK